MVGLESFCGLYCGACLCNIVKDEGNIKEVAARMKKPVEHLTCTECKTALHGDCGFVVCCTAKGLNNCSECPGMPCEELIQFAGDGIKHHAQVLDNLNRMKEIGLDEWLIEQKQKYTCSACGARLGWLDTRCRKCGEALAEKAED